jgi:PIN domain nuclease of toxin-antitoxin system
MSKYLLDTHIFLWSLLEPTCLRTELAHELENPANDLWLSPITTPFREATLNHEVAIQSRRIHLPHQDPADRFIAASAMVHGLTLMTADRSLIDGAGEYSVFANW